MKTNKKNMYKRVSKEIGWDFSKLNYEKEYFGDFEYWSTVKKHLNNSMMVLDVGCGSAQKTIEKLSAQKIYGIDKEKNMLKHAKNNLKKFPDKKNMFKFAKMDGYKKLKFKSNFFDVVISRHCGVNVDELKKVLKKGGVFISEDVDKLDCQELKEVFKRGQHFNDAIPLSNKTETNFLKAEFSSVKKFEIIKNEYYKSKEDLKYLLKRTPILDYYKDNEDDIVLDEYISKNTTPKGILLVRRLFGMIVVK